MLPKKLTSLLAFIAVAISAVPLMPSPTAEGQHSRPPFEYIFPVEADKASHFNDWGNDRSGGRLHRGNDLMAPKMTEVYSFAEGVVGQIGHSRRSGRYIRIDHADGWRSYYIHLNNDNFGTDDGEADWSLTIAPGIEEGTRVEAGQLIGWVGDSGNAEYSEPHVHFELHRNNYPVNPYFALREAREAELAQMNWREYLLRVQSSNSPIR